MMTEKKITIITPMYNEEKNIESCVQVLLSQTTQNFHVVFIDDGSTDKTIEALNFYLDNLGRKFSYQIISQTNSGAAKARLQGILVAKTEYVMIFDCDDRLSTNAVEEVQGVIEEQHADIISLQLKEEFNSREYRDFNYYDDREIYSGSEALEYSLFRWKIHGYTCVKRSIFLKSYNVYHQFNNNENYVNDDEVIVRLNFSHANYVAKCTGIYFYQNNTASTTKRLNNKRYLICNNAIILYQLFGKQGGAIGRNAQKELVGTFWGTLRYFKKNQQYFSNTKEWYEILLNTLCFIMEHKKEMKLSYRLRLRVFRAWLWLKWNR